MKIVMTAISGLLFALGLIVSGLCNPAKVLNFLDLSGAWDPSLALTMASAVLATTLGFRFVFGRSRPLYADQFYLPTSQDVDAALIVGALLFGLGWGLVGLCPGPALVALSLGNPRILVFVMAMLAGMAIGRYLAKPTVRGASLQSSHSHRT